MSCSPNVKQTNKLKTTKQKHPGVITLDHQSLRSGVIFGSGSGARRGGGGATTAKGIENHFYPLKIRNFTQS